MHELGRHSAKLNNSDTKGSHTQRNFLDLQKQKVEQWLLGTVKRREW